VFLETRQKQQEAIKLYQKAGMKRPEYGRYEWNWKIAIV
jgi:hypothetical protein